MSIPDELERIAARAPEVVVPPDTWARARRARRRERLAVVAVVAVVLAVAGTLTWWPQQGGVDPARADALGVPSRLWAVPERMSDRRSDESWMRDEVSSDVTSVGVGAAAWVTDGGLPVVVDARAGGYHLLDLPDFAGNNQVFTQGLGEPVVALSPDGRRLAYGYAVFGPSAATAPIPSGIRVIDLGDGSLVREVPVPGEEGTAISRITWSPDGRWLAFAGTQQSTWTRYSMGTTGRDGAGPVLGRVAPDSSAAQLRRTGNDEVPLAIDDRGVVWFENVEARTWDGRRTKRVPDGETPLDQLGLTADGTPVRLTPGPWASDATAVLVGDRNVVSIAPGIGARLTLATDLMTRVRPTVDRPEPDWPTDWGALAAPGAWLLAALVAGVFLIRPLRRVVRWRRGANDRSAEG